MARLAWPAAIVERPIGSGEGLAATFVPPKKEGVEPITSAIINVSEIDALAGIASRQGSILLAQLKSMAMGELLGQANASDATTRIVPAHSYRCCLSVGAQPGHCGVLLGDSSGGTPQRFLWFPTTDPNMSATAAPDPDPLETSLPFWKPGPDGVVEVQYGTPVIAETVIAAHISRQRGDADALDGHALLTRCKVAAVLAIMHHRSVVSGLDWDLSQTVMAVSDSTRDWIVSEAERAARAKVRERAIARADGEEFYDASRLETVKRSIQRMLERDGEQAGNVLRSRLGKREKRELFDQAISLLEAEGLVSERTDVYNGAKRVRYRIGSGLTHEVRPNTPSSEGVTPEVRPDQSNNVTDLDTRRSHDNTVPKLTAREWFANHIAELQAGGYSTTTSLAVMTAGEEAGFTRNNLRQAASAHPDVKTVDRKGGCATWSIDPGKQVSGYQSAAQWLDEYLDKQDGNTVLPPDAKLAGEAAGHPWHSVRRAAGLSPRIESVPAYGDAKTERIWKIVDVAEEAGA
ncbi:hypothetical protein [Mycolicibacterium mengxianglii]|uniref:hypothetical protein n=1 Tax=Mycolicibacterium mengxianglii TaxID=2736649 RepID=UPI0027DA5FDB|nr:hypothetical protein [Mycolicibacterium mengxianglii]